MAISLTEVKNWKGPRINPSCTPHNMLEISGKEFSEFLENVRFDR